MQNATRLCVGGMLLFLGAASPALAQVTMLNAAADPPAEAAGVQGAVRPSDGAPNSLVVIGPVSNGGTLPSIDLNKLLSQQSGAPTTNNADEYVNPPGGGSREVGGAVSGLLDQIWQK
jgi:hypothetical protein